MARRSHQDKWIHLAIHDNVKPIIERTQTPINIKILPKEFAYTCMDDHANEAKTLLVVVFAYVYIVCVCVHCRLTMKARNTNKNSAPSRCTATIKTHVDSMR